MSKNIWLALSAFIGAIIVALSPAHAKTKAEKAENLVRMSTDTVTYFTQDTAYDPLWKLADQAKAMVIIPRSFRGGFIFGASAGNAVMIARKENGTWSEPTFFTIGSVSFGFQAGGESSESVLLVMTNRGMEQMLSTNVKLGADLTLAAGPIGAGAKAQTADILAFSRSRGLYGGVSLEGAVLKARKNWTKAYYNADVTSADVIFRDRVSHPSSAGLQSAVWTLAHRDTPVNLAPLQPAAQPAIDPYAAPANGAPANLYNGAQSQQIQGAPLEPVPSPAEQVYDDDLYYQP